MIRPVGRISPDLGEAERGAQGPAVVGDVTVEPDIRVSSPDGGLIVDITANRASAER